MPHFPTPAPRTPVGRCPRRSWKARPADRDEAGREASPGGPGLPPGWGVGGEAALTAADTAGFSQASTRTQGRRQLCHLQRVLHRQGLILGRGLPWSSRCLQIKGCCLLMPALLPPSFSSLVCHSARHWECNWEQDSCGSSMRTGISG